MKIVNFITHSKLESALGYKKDYITVRILPEDFERFRTSFPGSGMNSRDNAVLMFSLNKDLVDYKYNGKSQTLPKRVKEGYFVGLIEKAREWTFQTPFVQGLRKTVGLTSNPPFYAHNLYEKKTHGLNLHQMRRLYRMVSAGNQKAITYARNVLGIPFSESPSQVKAVVLHHVRDLAERRVRRNPTREVLGAKKELVRIASEVAQNLILHFGPSMGGYEKVANSEALFNGVKRVMNEMSYGPDNPNFEKFSMYFPKSYNVQEWEKGGNLDDHLWWGQTDKGKYAVIRKGIELAKRGKVFSNRRVRRNPARSHRERIAIDTVRHPMKGYFLGGPDLAESVRYLRSLGYSMAQLKKLNPEVEDILEGRKSILPNRRKGPVTEREIRAMYRRHGVRLSQRGMFGKGYDAVSEYGYVMGRGPYKTAKEAERYVIKFYKKRPRLVRQ